MNQPIINRSSYAKPRLSHPNYRQWLTERQISGTLLTAAFMMAAFSAFLALVQTATPDLVGNDGYYHIKMAYLMRTQGLVPSFEWLQLTVLNAREFVDHHFLYHVLLIPFTFGDLRWGAKLASVLFPTGTFLAVWWLLRAQRIPYAELWSLGMLMVSEAFIYRMSMPRAQSLSLAVLVLGLHWLLTARYARLLPLAFAYVWLYDGFPLILLLVGVYVAAYALVERRLAWRALLYAGLGIALGLVINPFFPDNLLFIYRHVAPKLLNPTATRVGNEWYPYDTAQLIGNSGPALLAFLAGVLALGLNAERMHSRTAAALFLSILSGAMLFQSRRFVEYYPAFALIFAALAWAPLFQDWLDSERNKSVSTSSQSHSWTARLTPDAAARRRTAAGAMLVVLLAGTYLNLGAARASVQRSKPADRYARAASWLKNNSPGGSRVFQTDWDDFTRLFFYNTHNIYTLGLDPTYMQLYNPALYETWVDISKGRIDQPATPIAERFGAAYVFTDLRHKTFLEKAYDDPNLREVYRDDDAVIFQVDPAAIQP